MKGPGKIDMESLPDSFREEKIFYFNGMCSNLPVFHPSERSTHSTSCFRFQFLSMSLQWTCFVGSPAFRSRSININTWLHEGAARLNPLQIPYHENPRVLGVPQLNMSEGAACVKPGAGATSGKSWDYRTSPPFAENNSRFWFHVTWWIFWTCLLWNLVRLFCLGGSSCSRQNWRLSLNLWRSPRSWCLPPSPIFSLWGIYSEMTISPRNPWTEYHWESWGKSLQIPGPGWHNLWGYRGS